MHDVWSSNSVEDMLLIVDRIFFTVSGLILTASLLKKKNLECEGYCPDVCSLCTTLCLGFR